MSSLPLSHSFRISEQDLQCELQIAKRWIETKSNRPNSLLGVLHSLESMKEVFPSLYKLLQIGVTIPVSSAQCERAFSSLKIIKSWLRTSMTDVRLADLTTLGVMKDRAKRLDLSLIVDSFARGHQNRKIILL